MRAGDADGAAECYATLREFWGGIAARQQDG
jgi:hypothetical protein